MTNFTPIPGGAAANAATINNPLQQLSNTIGDLTTLSATPKNSVVAALGATPLGTLATTHSGAIAELLAKFNLGIPALTIGPWFDLADYADLEAAAVAIDVAPASLLIHTATTVTADLPVPSTLDLVFQPGGVISVESGQTLTIGHIQAGRQHIFNCLGTGPSTGKVVFSSGLVSEIYPEWWGAVGDGVADDTDAVQAAISCGSSAIPPNISDPSINCVLKNKYRIYNHHRADALDNTDSALWIEHNNITIDGRGTGQLLLSDPQDYGAIYGYDGGAYRLYSHITIRGLSIISDQLHPLSALYSHHAIRFLKCEYLTVEDCYIANINGVAIGIVSLGGAIKRTGAYIRNNIIKNCSSSTAIYIKQWMEDIIVSGNTIEGDPDISTYPTDDRIYIACVDFVATWSNASTYVISSRVKGSDNKIYYAITVGGQAEDPVTDTNNTYWVFLSNDLNRDSHVVITGNIIKYSRAKAIGLGATDGFVIANNDIRLCWYGIYVADEASVTGCISGTISGNTIVEAGYNSTSFPGGVYNLVANVSAGIVVHDSPTAQSHDINIVGNTIISDPQYFNLPYAQQFKAGIRVTGANIFITGNLIMGNSDLANGIYYGITFFDTSSNVVISGNTVCNIEKSGVMFEGGNNTKIYTTIAILDNVFRNTVKVGTSGYGIPLYPYDTSSQFIVKHNQFLESRYGAALPTSCINISGGAGMRKGPLSVIWGLVDTYAGVCMYNDIGEKFFYLTAPLNGIYVLGDRLYPRTALTGQPSCLICTVAGGLYKEAWSNAGTYVRFDQVKGSDNKIYYAITVGGQAEDPVTDTNNTYWVVLASTAATFINGPVLP